MKLLLYPEDSDLLSIYLQDAILLVKNMDFSPQEGFIGVFNRFMWEESERKVYHRTLCGVRVQGVTKARYRGFDRSDLTLVLDLLAILVKDSGLNFIFAAGQELYLTTEPEWRCYLEDFGQPWPTTKCPGHE